MNKPVKSYPVSPCYNYNDVIQYIEEKYNIYVNDYYGYFEDNSKPFCSFWKWLLDDQFSNVHNGTVQYLDFSEDYITSEELPAWVYDILFLIGYEFVIDANDMILFWVEW